MWMTRRCSRRRILPYLVVLNCILCLLYLIPLRIDFSNTMISDEEIATEAIRKAVGPIGSNASSLVLPLENTIIFYPNPHYCQREGRDVYILFIVISSPGNWDAREAIRATLKQSVNGFNKRRWHGSTQRNNSVLFFSGVSQDPNTQRKLEAEAALYGDIVIDNLIDTYLNMTVKVLRMLKWIQSTCPHLKFLLKIDDDVHLNLLKFFQFFNSISRLHGSGNGAELVIAGHHYQDMKPVRTLAPPNGKWYSPPEVWPSETYPDFIGGPAYVLGSQALKRIYEKSLGTPLLHLEDVFLTGIVANAGLGMQLSGIPNIITYWPRLGPFIHSSCYIQNQFLIHSVSPESIKCWNQFNSEDFICSHWPLVLSTMLC